MADKKKKGFWRTISRRDPSSRHSMIEASSQYSLTDSSDDLRSARKSREVSSTGSLDRLTTKPPKSGLFKLKPKTPAFWKPLFRRSSSPTASTAASTISPPYRHQLVQTDTPTKTSTSDFGVQAVIVDRVTHTRDALVQTCPAWDDRPGSAGGKLHSKENPVESRAELSPGIKRSPEVAVDISLDTPALTSALECTQQPTPEFPTDIAASNENTTGSKKPDTLPDILTPNIITMSENISTKVEFDDSEWRTFCENFPEIQSSLQKDVKKQINSDLKTDNPFSLVKNDFDELRNDFGASEIPEKSSVLISSQDVDLLKEQADLSLLNCEDKLPPVENAIYQHGPMMNEKSNYRLDKYRKTSASPESGVIKFQEDEFRPRSSEPIRDSEHASMINSCDSSVRNSMSSGIDTLLQPGITKFDSCDNLEQLENEIIRALYSPVQECDINQLDINIQKTICISEQSKDSISDRADLTVPTSNITVEIINAEKNDIMDEVELNNQLLSDSASNKPWLSLGVPLENITEESATDDESNSQIEYPHNITLPKMDIRSGPESEVKLECLTFPDYTASVSPGVAAVNEVSEVFVELPPRKAKICFDVRELARISRARANSYDSADDMTSVLNEIAKTNSCKDSEKTENTEQTTAPTIQPHSEEDLECSNTGNYPEKTHVSHTYITLKQPDMLTSEDPDSNLIPPPPPPPPPPSSVLKRCNEKHLTPNQSGVDSLSVSTSPDPTSSPNTPGRSAMVFELEQKFLTRQKMADDLESITKRIAMDAQKDSNGLSNNGNGYMNGQNYQNGYHNGHVEHRSPSPTTLSISKTPVLYEYITKEENPVKFAAKTVITDQPPPPGAVLIDEKVTVDGDQVHRDKYFALPVKEVLKEKTSTTKFIPAPSKYEGIGPTEDGVPLSLRQSVKKENMSDWYKTMYKTLHKIENEDDHYVIGYTSDPEVKREEMKSPKKLDIMSDDPHHHDNTTNGSVLVHAYPASAKSSLNTYSSHPRPIADYQPGYSSSVDNQPNLVSKRYFPTVPQTKPSYEIKNGFESENYVLKRNLCIEPEAETQKDWYRQVQQGGDIPQFGLGKAAPEKPLSPVVGPAPPQQVHSNGSYTYPKASRPTTLPPENGINGNYNAYADHMRQAIHHEMHQRGYQTSPPNDKSPRKLSLEKNILGQALYNFAAESPREISLKKGDVVIIHRELDKNWYEGEHNAAVGIFPISYVEVLPPEHTSSPQPPPKVQEGIGKVLYDFTAHTSVELHARKGDEIQLVRKVDDNWFEGRINGKKGIIPASYVNVIEKPCPALSPKRHTISPPKSSPRLLEISGSTPISPVSSTTLSSPSLTSGHHEPISNGSRNITKKGNRLIEPVPYRALYRYSPQNADELELLDGDTVYVVEMCDDGWFVGTSVRTGELGIIPGNYMEKVC